MKRRHVTRRVLAALADTPVVFVHGFNVNFEDAVYRTAQITYDLQFDGAPFLFSWPTSGNISFPFMLATVLFLVVYYFAFAKRNFKGPQAMGDASELTEIEREFSQAAREVGGS